MEKIKNICRDLGKAFTIGLLSGGAAAAVLLLGGFLFGGFTFRAALEAAKDGLLLIAALGQILQSVKVRYRIRAAAGTICIRLMRQKQTNPYILPVRKKSLYFCGLGSEHFEPAGSHRSRWRGCGKFLHFSGIKRRE